MIGERSPKVKRAGTEGHSNFSLSFFFSGANLPRGEFVAMIKLMSTREIVIELVNKLPEDTPLEKIAAQIELLAGIKTAREQARRGEGMPAEQARKLVKEWATRSS